MNKHYIRQHSAAGITPSEVNLEIYLIFMNINKLVQFVSLRLLARTRSISKQTNIMNINEYPFSLWKQYKFRIEIICA